MFVILLISVAIVGLVLQCKDFCTPVIFNWQVFVSTFPLQCLWIGFGLFMYRHFEPRILKVPSQGSVFVQKIYGISWKRWAIPLNYVLSLELFLVCLVIAGMLFLFVFMDCYINSFDMPVSKILLRWDLAKLIVCAIVNCLLLWY